MTLDWTDYSHEFEDLGTGRDIYVQNMDINDWESFWKLIRQEEYGLEYHFNGDQEDPPQHASELMEHAKKGDACTFRFTAEGMDFSGYFWPGEIELDFSTRDVQNQEQFDDLLRFMQKLADEMKKPVLLAHEMNAAEEILTVRPND